MADSSQFHEVGPEELKTALNAETTASPEQLTESFPDNEVYTKTGTLATRKEVLSYYAYFAGNNGIGAYQYAYLILQNLIYQAGFNPNVLPLGSSNCDVDVTAPCHVFWNGGTKSYVSVILIGNGLAFLCTSLVFLSIGSLADYGSWNPWIVRVFSVLCMALQFGMLGTTTAQSWGAAMALYVLIITTWNVCYAFFNAVFPKLADDLPEVQKAKEDRLNGSITKEQCEYTSSIQRSRIMNISWAWNNIGFIICCLLSLATLFGLHAEDSTAANNWGYSVSLAVCTGFWVLAAIPWFLWEKNRPGPPIPQGENYLTFGFKRTWFTFKQAWKLKQTFAYLICYFLLADGVGTSLSLISIAQSQSIAFSAIKNTYFILVQSVSALFAVYLFFYTQRYFQLRTKTMLQISNFCCVLYPLWGMIGIWTNKIGYHNAWEFWLVAVLYGFAFGCQYSYGQAFMGELVPKGREFMFFSLLGIVSKGSSWIGPIVSSAIADSSGNQWLAFPFVAALTFVPFVGIQFISVEKSRVECAAYLAEEAKVLRKVSGQFEDVSGDAENTVKTL